MDILDIFKFTYSWVRSKASQGLYLWLIAVNLMAAGLLVLSVVMFIGTLLLPVSVLNMPTDDPAFMSLFASFAGLGLAGAVAGVTLFIFALLAQGYFETMTMFRALDAKGRQSVDWVPRKYANYILLGILNFLYATFSLLNRKWWPLVAAFYILLLASFLFPLLFILTALVGLAYLVLFIYNGVRQSMSFPIYLESEMRKTEAINRSWKLTEGRALDVFVTSLAIMIAWGIILGVVGGAFQLFRLLPGGVFIFLMASFLLAPFDSFTGSFTSVGIYHALRTGGQQKVARGRMTGKKMPKARKAKGR
jgi:hypothetical protein